MPYSQAMMAWSLVRNHQPWNPAEPEGWAGDLHSEVAIALGLENWAELCLFSAAGSALDWHGMDAWFEFYGVRVTLDVTANPSKFNGYKADVIVTPVAIENADERRDLAATIAEELMSKRQEAAAHQRQQRRTMRAMTACA
ncbi:hypothetical protein EXS71_04205 [Candidatus Uhrbacteria bacterium]|nr:hypothetical protein [Candidatus Uhrbacteria bacterium]